MIVPGSPKKENVTSINSHRLNLESGPPVISPALHTHSNFQPLPGPSPSLVIPSLDPHLSTSRLFWYIFWLCLAEVTYLGVTLANYTLVTSLIAKVHNGDKGDWNPRASLPLSLLYLAPSCLVLLVSMITFASKRYNYLIRKVLLGAVSLALLGGVAGSAYSIYSFIITYQKYECQQYEKWTAGMVRVVYVVVLLCPLPFRCGCIVALKRDVSLYQHGSSTNQMSAFAEAPVTDGWMNALHVLDIFTLMWCMPMCCRRLDNHTRHLVQHIFQLIYEIILLTVAIIELKHVDLLVVVAGLLACVMSITRIYMMGTVFNTFALVAGLFLIGDNVANFSCDGDKQWLFLVLFSIVASIIRFKSLLHAYLEARVQVHNWLMAQVPWVATISYAAYGMERFYQIKDFLSLRRHYDCSRHHYEISQYKQNEDTPLVAKKKPSKMKMSYLPLLVLLLVFIGFCLIIAFSGTMGAMFPQFRGGSKVKEVETWNTSECTLLYYDAVYKDTHTLYYYFVQTSSGDNILAIPIETRYADPLNMNEFNENYQLNLWNHVTIPCHIPESPILANDTIYDTFDYDRRRAVWDRVAILGSSSTLSHFQSNYHLWLSLPPLMITLGIVLFVAGILILRHLLRTSRNVKFKRPK